MNESGYQIGKAYRLMLEGAYYRVTLVQIDGDTHPPNGRVIIREHSIDSFEGRSNIRKRHTKWSEVVPSATVPLTDLLP